MSTTIRSVSGSEMLPVPPLPAREGKMASAFNWATVKGLVKALMKELGFFRAIGLLLQASTLGMIFNKPKWEPDKFTFDDSAVEKRFREVFTEDLLIMVIFNILRRKYGEERADQITAGLAIPITLPFVIKAFMSLSENPQIRQVRQVLTDFHGRDAGYQYTEMVAADQSEIRCHFTRCAHAIVFRAYGLNSFAAYMCLADHIMFDNIAPGLVFSREHTLGLGDDCCDHVFRLRKPGEVNNESQYADCAGMKYGA